MRNPVERYHASRKLADAEDVFLSVKALPSKVGSMILWSKNGVVWRRVGDDQWEPLHEMYGYEAQSVQGIFPSHYVAVPRRAWFEIKQLPSEKS